MHLAVLPIVVERPTAVYAWAKFVFLVWGANPSPPLYSLPFVLPPPSLFIPAPAA